MMKTVLCHSVKPEPIMLSVLPIIPSRIFTYYSYFIPIPSPIIPVIFFFIVSVTMRSTVY